jgi:hypothetical protein
MSEKQYDPSLLLDHLKVHLQARNDAALSRALGVNPPLLSKIRHRRQAVGAALLIRINEVTGMEIADLNKIMGERRQRTRVSPTIGRPNSSSLLN